MYYARERYVASRDCGTVSQISNLRPSGLPDSLNLPTLLENATRPFCDQNRICRFSKPCAPTTYEFCASRWLHFAAEASRARAVVVALRKTDLFLTRFNTKKGGRGPKPPSNRIKPNKTGYESRGLGKKLTTPIQNQTKILLFPYLFPTELGRGAYQYGQN